MKKLNKILLTMALVLITVAANAQFRGYYPRSHRPLNQNRIGKDGEIKKDQYVQRNNGPSKLYLSLDYAATQPLGSLKNYTNKTNFNGWRISVLYALNKKWQIGLSSGFYAYSDRLPRSVYPNKNGAISAVQTHTLQLIPLQPTILYFPEVKSKSIKPYIGLSIGLMDVNYQNYWGEFVEKKNSIAFSASPMVGIRIPFSSTSPLQFNADLRYNFIPYTEKEISGIHAVGINAGLSLNIR